jgi:hypothetical protein
MLRCCLVAVATGMFVTAGGAHVAHAARPSTEQYHGLPTEQRRVPANEQYRGDVSIV